MRPVSYRLGLIGYPLEHSLSPALHQAALRATGLQGEYHLYPIPPDPNRSSMIQELLGRLRIGEIHGLNVTVPLKQAVIPFMDRLTHAAQSVGAVNTIYLSDGGLVGENTDAPGFWADLMRQHIPRKNSFASALVLGAGGAARAVVYALIQAGWQVMVAARRLEQAQELVASLSQSVVGEVRPRPAQRTSGNRFGLQAARLRSDAMARVLPADLALIVNATPLGLFPQIYISPWPFDLAFPKGAFVYDLVYNPAETPLMRQARQEGLPTSNGLGMLVEQAALAFECWTGMPAPREAMRETIMEKQG